MILKVTLVLKIYSYALRFIPSSNSLLDQTSTRSALWEKTWNAALQSRKKGCLLGFLLCFSVLTHSTQSIEINLLS